MKSQTPSISILTGYLGAGKTTLLQHIIKNLKKKFAIIMNEFGEIGIDTEIIQGKNVNIAELTGGCVCCSLAGEFEEAIKEVREKYNPELIIVETTGIAEPDALLTDVSSTFPDLILDSVITIVDADAVVRFPQLGRTGIAQIEMADLILLNKIDLVTESQRVELKAKLRTRNPKAPIIETDHCNVDINLLFGLDVEHKVEAPLVHEHRFQSFHYTFKKPINRELFEQFLNQLPPSFYRIKGFVQFQEDATHLLNFVAGRWELNEMDSDNHTIVFIGEGIVPVKTKIINTLGKLENE